MIETEQVRRARTRIAAWQNAGAIKRCLASFTVDAEMRDTIAMIEGPPCDRILKDIHTATINHPGGHAFELRERCDLPKSYRRHARVLTSTTVSMAERSEAQLALTEVLALHGCREVMFDEAGVFTLAPSVSTISLNGVMKYPGIFTLSEGLLSASTFLSVGKLERVASSTLDALEIFTESIAYRTD